MTMHESDRKLKCRSFVFVVITAFMVFGPAGLAIESPISPAPGPPIGDPTTPQTSLSKTGTELIPTGRYNSPSEGNRIVTGNLAGGSHFRYAGGIVPYQSVQYFQSPNFAVANGPGAGSLNSFIRRSAGVGYPQQGFSLNEPYYLGSQTVTSIQRGSESELELSRVTFPEDTDDFARQLSPVTDSQYSYGQQRPLSRSMKELEDVISREIELQKKLTQQQESSEKELTELEQIEYDLAQRFKTTTEDKKGLFNEIFESEKLPEPAKPDEPASEPDIGEQPKEGPKDFSQQPLEDAAEAEDQQGDISDAVQDDNAPDKQEENSKFELQVGKKPDKQQSESEFELQVGKKLELPEVDHAAAAAIRGPHKTFEDWAKAKFTEYMKAAAEFLKKGKYYKAADAYTLAGVYQRENPLAYAGKALALFAAGEYMSSSYFLQRAITLSPEYAKRKIDLAAVLVDRDMIENRIIEMATWQQRSKSPELAFLMAYIFYQNNNLPAAQVGAKLAAQRMGPNPALKSLMQAINSAALTTR